MATISKSTLQFLNDLKQNNERDWFQANKKRFETAKSEFEQFVDELIKGIAGFDPSIAHQTAKNAVFRIYKDTRFSKDKTPYKTNFGAHFTAARNKSEMHSRAGYYIHLEPGNSFLAGGAYLPQGDWLKGIRQEIHFNGQSLVDLLNQAEFVATFGKMEGEKLKTSPKDYPADHPHIELLKHKSFLATHKLSDEQVCATDFLNHSVKVYQTLKPFDDFLNNGLELN